MPPNLTIQIVGWNSEKHLVAAARALQAIPEEQALIRYIDNASTDTSVQIIQSLLPTADIIELKENEGFARAHNIGFAKCTTPFVLTHDPDVELNWDEVKKLLKYIKAHSQVGAIQGKLLRRESDIIDSVGIVLTLTLNGRERGAGEKDVGQYEQKAAVDAVTGACGLYRMEALRNVAHGPDEIFDNDFFAYKEDVDLGWRLKRAGFKSMYLPHLMGYHSRTLGKRGAMPWFMNPEEFPKRLRSPRTHYSLRNYIWMITKNKSLKDVLLYDWFIIPRLACWLLLSLLYPPLLRAWLEAARGLPRVLKKRKVTQ